MSRGLRSIFVFLAHQFVGTWGVPLLANLGLTSLVEELSNFFGWKSHLRFVRWLLTENHFYPVQILVGLYFGWLLSRRLHHRSMLWIWVVPFVILFFVFAATPPLTPWSSMLIRPHTIQSRLSFYFGNGCQVQSRCLDQLFVTMPFYASLAYSLGAFFAQNFSKRSTLNAQSPDGSGSA
jgi:hypothetical protein